MRTILSPTPSLVLAVVLATTWILAVPAPAAGGPVVVTPYGAVEGSTDGEVDAFLGIPFAAPPVGPLRWQPPRPPGPWDGTLAATAWPPPCPQKGPDDGVVGAEDCLYLNVWAPSGAAPGSLPVLVFLHGGGNVQGSTSVGQMGTRLYEGDLLALRGRVVVVTTQYRLGVLGFLVHPALSTASATGTSGNYGLLDQQAALRWVRDAIGPFGGDPGRVMLFGESAGATDTLMQLASPLAAGLFARALLESGGDQARSLEQRTVEGLRIAEALGCPDPATAGSCLLERTPEELVRVLDGLGGSDVTSGGLVRTPVGPTVDGLVLPERPTRALEAGRFNHVPLVIGANADETRLWVPELGEAAYELLVRGLLAPWGPGTADRALELYPVGPGGYPTGTEAWAAMTGDFQFVCPSRRFAAAAAGSQAEPVFRYFFSQRLSGDLLSPYGTFHGLELFFVFQRLERLDLYAPTREDLDLERSILELWTSFATTGIPSSTGTPDWPAYDPATDPYLELGTPTGVHEGLRTERCDFWDELTARLPGPTPKRPGGHTGR